MSARKLKSGAKAPDFKTLAGTLSPVTLADTPAKARLFSVVPSLDTPVCSLQTKKFEEGIAALGDAVASYTVSLDSPFAQKRFCTGRRRQVDADALGRPRPVVRQELGAYSSKGCRCRCSRGRCVVVDPAGTVTYAEYVPEVTSHPNYDAALAALNAASK